MHKTATYRQIEFARRQLVRGDEGMPEDLLLPKLEWVKDSHSEMQLNDV